MKLWQVRILRPVLNLGKVDYIWGLLQVSTFSHSCLLETELNDPMISHLTVDQEK
jgi:hypothetical protein